MVDPENAIARRLSPQAREHYEWLRAMTNDELRSHLEAAPPSGAAAFALYQLDRIEGYRSALDTLSGHVPEGERETSKAAARKVQVTARSTAARVLVAIAHFGEATNEMVETFSGLDGNTVRPRVGELRNGGYIERSGATRPTSKGNDAELHRLTDDGRRKLRELQDQGHEGALRLLPAAAPRLFPAD